MANIKVVQPEVIADVNGTVSATIAIATDSKVVSYGDSNVKDTLDGLKNDLASHDFKYAGSATEGGAANSVANALTVTVGTNAAQTFDGSAAKSIEITPATVGALAADAVATEAAKVSNKLTLTGGVNAEYDGSAAKSVSVAAYNHTHQYAGSSSVGGAATSAEKVANSLTITVGEEDAVSYDGSAVKTIEITPETVGAAAASHTHAGSEITGTIAASQISGVLDISNMPSGVMERITVVANEAAMLALTSNDIQNGDTVKLADTGVMYFVKDDSKLGTDDAFEEYTAGAATTVPWSGITGKPDTFTPSEHTHLYAGSSTAGGAANSVANSLSISLNGGEATVFNGSAAKTVNITAASVGAYTQTETDNKISTAVDNFNTSTVAPIDTRLTEAESKIDDLQEAANNATLTAWPVGSVYQATAAAAPATLFGGTWTEIGTMVAVAGSTNYTIHMYQRTA